MISKKLQNTLFSIIFGLSLISFLVVVIPFETIFTNQNILIVQILVKLLIIPLIIAFISVYPNILKYREVKNNRERSKVISVMSYFPAFTYTLAIVINSLYVITRQFAPIGVYPVSWCLWFFVLVVGLTVISLVSHLFWRLEIRLSQKDHIIIDICIVIISICYLLVNLQILDYYHDVLVRRVGKGDFELLLVYIAIIAFIIIHIYKFIRLVKEDEVSIDIRFDELSPEHPNVIEAEYNRAYNYVLNDFENEIAGYDDDKENDIQDIPLMDNKTEVTEHQMTTIENVKKIVKVEHVQEVVYVPVSEDNKLQLANEQKVLDEETIELQKLQDEYQNLQIELSMKKQEYLDNMPKAKVSKKAKEIKPSYKSLISYAKRLKNVNCIENEKFTTAKFLINKNVFLILATTEKDYRCTFYADLEKISSWMVSIPSITKAGSPKGENWFKFTNKGIIDETLVREIIKTAHMEITKIEEEKAKNKRKKKTPVRDNE